jgi:hypothetical protein
MELPVYKIVVNDDDETGVDFVSLVDRPAIQKDFMLFKDQFVDPTANETEDEFISRCIPVMIGEGMEQDQAAAVCYSKWSSKDKFAEGMPHYTKDGKLYEGPTHKDADGRLMTGATHTADSEYLYHKDELQKFESYDDYPEAAKENAKVALRWAEENGWGDCGTAVGKIRANQLANGEAITRDTIARMAGFERHRQNSDKELGDGCGRLMWLAWGGDEGIEWASRKLQQIDMRQAYSVQSEEKRIVTGPAMLADLPIYRYDDIRGEYYVTFDADTIWKIAKKFVRNDAYKAVNTDHANPVKEGVHMIESYFIDRKRGVMPPTGYEDAKDGSWFLTYLIDNEEIWAKVKDGEWKGFSVEGLFDMEEQDEVLEMMREITAMLKNFA